MRWILASKCWSAVQLAFSLAVGIIAVTTAVRLLTALKLRLKKVHK